jgi:hypothetical protein
MDGQVLRKIRQMGGGGSRREHGEKEINTLFLGVPGRGTISDDILVFMGV